MLPYKRVKTSHPQQSSSVSHGSSQGRTLYSSASSYTPSSATMKNVSSSSSSTSTTLKTKKGRDTHPEGVGIPIHLTFYDGKPKDCTISLKDSEEDLSELSIELSLATWSSVKDAKAGKIRDNASLNIKINQPKCNGYTVEFKRNGENFKVALPCPTNTDKSVSTCSVLRGKSLSSLCFSCEFLQNNLKGNAKVSPLHSRLLYC
jgi:hypothetical protein